MEREIYIVEDPLDISHGSWYKIQYFVKYKNILFQFNVVYSGEKWQGGLELLDLCRSDV